MTTTRNTAARDIKANTTIRFRGKTRLALSDAHLDIDEAGNVWAYIVLAPYPGQPLNINCLSAYPLELV